MSGRTWGAAAAVSALLLVGCSVTDRAGGGPTSDAPATTAEPVARLQVMAPADPGGGWDRTARAMAESLEETGLARNVRVTNVGGAGGTIGLAEFVDERSEEYLMVTGLVMVGAIETNRSPSTLDDVTPIARLTAEDEIDVVPADSPYGTIFDLIEDVRVRGQEVSIAGGSIGGTDHILAALIVQGAGIPLERLNYVAHSGGGESLAALQAGEVAVGIAGVGEFADEVKAGRLRALAVSGSDRIADIDAPTLTEAGLGLELRNWRGVVAPPGLSDEARERLVALVDELVVSDAWRDHLARNEWDDAYLSGDEFGTFLESEQTRVESVLEELGLGG